MTPAPAIMLSDIYPTAWFGCRLAGVGQGDTVLVLGAGPSASARRSRRSSNAVSRDAGSAGLRQGR
jgi:hypothetical protein